MGTRSSGLPISSRESSLTALVRAFKFLKLEETLPALFDGRITDRNPSSPHLVCPFQVRESILTAWVQGLQVPKVGGNTSRSLQWKDYKPEPLKSDHLVCSFQVGSWA